MKVVGNLLAILAGLVVIGGTGFGAWWIVTAKAPATKSTSHAPAAEFKKVNESELGTVTLTEDAEKRLGVVAGVIEMKDVLRARTYGGEVIAPAGKTILVSAPMQGTLQAPKDGVPQAGELIKKGRHVISLMPLFSPEASMTMAASRADIEGQVKNAETQVAAMKLALARAERLFNEEAGSKRAVEEAQAQHDLAQRTLEAANLRLAILTKAVGNVADGVAKPIEVTSPEDGILRNVLALPGQSVPSGGALFEVVDLSEVWVRVPVYVGDLRDLASEGNAEVGDLSMRSGDPTWSATPVKAPPSANPLSATVDLFYAVTKNAEAKLTPGQRVGVKLRTTESGSSLTAPWSSIVHDLSGGTWVYEVKGPRTYQRRRVVVRYSLDGLAVLASGPAAGTKVVSEGAIELFGAETGFIK